jgi:hypothetical protein
VYIATPLILSNGDNETFALKFDGANPIKMFFKA